jgi:hypothetical protein
MRERSAASSVVETSTPPSVVLTVTAKGGSFNSQVPGFATAARLPVPSNTAVSNRDNPEKVLAVRLDLMNSSPYPLALLTGEC